MSGLPAPEQMGTWSARWGGPPGITLLAGGRGSMTPSPWHCSLKQRIAAQLVFNVPKTNLNAQRSHHVKGYNFKLQVQNLREGKQKVNYIYLHCWYSQVRPHPDLSHLIPQLTHPMPVRLFCPTPHLSSCFAGYGSCFFRVITTFSSLQCLPTSWTSRTCQLITNQPLITYPYVL